MAGAPIDGSSLSTRVAGVVAVFLILSLFLANGLFHRAGSRAIDREVARACYERAGWLAVELTASLNPDGSSTERSKELLYRAARQMDVSLVMFYEADLPVITAHGPSLSRALKTFDKYPRAGTRMDSGVSPWVPKFSGDRDRSRYPDRGGRPVRVQEHYPYAVETPVGSRMSLRVVPLAFDPVSTQAFTNGLTFVGLMLLLASVLVVGRIMRPLQRLADGVARLGRGDPSHIRVSGSGEIARIGRTANRMADLTSAARNEGQRVMSTITTAFQAPVKAAVRQMDAVDLTAVPPGARASVEELLSTVGELAAVVDAIGTWADLEAGTVEVERKDADLRALVEATAKACSVEVVLDFHEDVEEYIDTDADALARVFRELFGNAKEHGTAPIEIHAERGHTKIELTIRDHGEGIPDMEEMRRVFAVFHRGSGATEASGLGLGLRIARLMMDALRGGISLKNHPEGGLEVRLWLPAPPIRVTEVDRGLASMGWNQSQDVEVVKTDPGAPVPQPPKVEAKAEAPTPKPKAKPKPKPKPEAPKAKPKPKPKPAVKPKPIDDLLEPPEPESGPEVVDFADPMEPDATGSAPIGPVPIAPSTPPPPPTQLDEDPYEPF